MSYLLDTNACIAIINGRPQGVRRRLQAALTRGEPVEIRTDAFEARALQHEIDHCAGLLFLDRVAGAHAVYARKTYL